MSALSAVFILLIFMNSLQNGDVSSQQSGSVVALLQSIFEKIGLSLTVSSYIVRKSAHFIEFAVLGILLTTTLKAYTNKILKNIFAPLFIGLFVAVSDEYIQLYSDGRAGMVQDVVLDFAGFITGLCLTALVLMLREKRKDKK
jgi:VanZ family protein